ncbi:MAG TPA: hypothetical protein VF290_17540 [Pyrinomonadaceae bacterium]
MKIYRGVIERRVGHQHYLTVRAIVNEAFDSGSIVNDCQHDVATHHVPVLAVGDRKSAVLEVINAFIFWRSFRHSQSHHD